MSHRSKTQSRSWMERALSLVLAAVLLAGTIPAMTLPTSAHWADQYLDQLVDWGVMRADQTANPDSPVTRAEFAGVINRAYGYTEKGEIPFEDVAVTDWFYDDISIAYTAGYMAGTSETTASPNETLTREMAVCILGRNMMMKETPGESLAFSDSRDVSFWAQGMVKTAVDNYIISGYPDNSFGPQDAISRGQMAVLVSQCLGNPISESGSYELGGVFGNVTITAPNVTLRNTTISGDLYVSGGVGLGGIKLENVNVLGRIIVSGTGESEGGDASVIMRNVTAEEMLVDNMRNKTVTIRADGITDIAKTTVRTNAYLEDNNTDDKGLMSIELDGEPGTRLTLAGRIKEVVNKTPNSYIQVGKGTVAKITVDEAATNSTVQLDRNTKVKEMNLDVGTTVTGEGDIEKLNINAPGSVVSMLPDKIYIRPGLTASIAGIVMDHIAAEEGSLDPRLLSGYPAARDIAPTGFRADFAGNKKGTIYWAVSAITDGSIREDDLISPPSYGSRAISNGSLAVPTGGEEISAQVTGLSVGGSYYLSAILVDEQLNRSPVKVISFSTPDNTVPAFGQGYPYMSLITKNVAQVTVMPTKSCKMYYALLPQGAQAPTVNDLKSAAVTGNLGYGVRDVTKNTESVFTVNSQRLEELKTYTLYLWLTDVDGVNSSAIVSLPVPVPDETPPVVEIPVQNSATGTSVTLTSAMNELGTIFWAVVLPETDYPLPNKNSNPLDKDNNLDEHGNAVTSRLESLFAKTCVENGRNALVRGATPVGTANTDVTINVPNGLEPEKTYKLYYIGKDAAGNYSEKVGVITIKTADTNGPIVSQYFRNEAGDKAVDPLANDNVVLDFNEPITVDASKELLSLYETSIGKGEDKSQAAMAAAKRELRDKLQANFILHQPDQYKPNQLIEDITNLDEEEKLKKKESLHSWIDYSEIVVQKSGDKMGHIEVVFPNGKAIQLQSDTTYYFELRNVKDDAEPPKNPALGSDKSTTLTYLNTQNTEHSLDQFTTTFASVIMGDNSDTLSDEEYPKWHGTGDQAGASNGRARVDTAFFIQPEATEGVDTGKYFEIAIFASKRVDYDLYYRIVRTSDNKVVTDDGEYAGNKLPDGTKVADEENGWIYIGEGTSPSTANKDGRYPSTVFGRILGLDRKFPALKTLGEGLRYEFALSVTKIGNSSTYESWNEKEPITFNVYVMAGAQRELSGAMPVGSSGYTEESACQMVKSIGKPSPLTIDALFYDTDPPVFLNGTPSFKSDEENASIENIEFDLGERPGSKLWYRIVPKDRPNVFPIDIEVKNPVGTIAAGSKLNSVLQADDFYKVIDEQTKLTDGRGELVDGTDDDNNPIKHLKYYWVDDKDGKLQENIQSDTYAPDVKRGEITYTYTGGIQTSPMHMGEEDIALEPDTEYYVYIVLTPASGYINEKNRPAVYVYNFKTDAAPKPRIDLVDDTNGAVNIRINYPSWAGTANSNAEAHLNWALFQANDGEAYLETRDVDIPPEIIGYKSMTMLEALETTYSASVAFGSAASIPADTEYGTKWDGYTVFDVFASETQKSDLVTQIVTTSSVGQVNSNTLKTNEMDITSEQYFSADWKTGAKLKEGETVESITGLFLVAAHNERSEPGRGSWYLVDSFKVLRPVRVTSNAAPVLLNIDGNATGAGVSGSISMVNVSSTNPTVSGSITLTFDKEVYWRKKNVTNSIDYMVIPDSSAPAGNADNATVGILHDLVDPTLKPYIKVIQQSGGPFTSYTLMIEDLPISAAKTFNLLGNTGNIAAKRGNNGGFIQIQIKSGYYQEPVLGPDGKPTGDKTEWYKPEISVTNYNYGGGVGPTGTINATQIWEVDDSGTPPKPTLNPPELKDVGGTVSGTYTEAGGFKISANQLRIRFSDELFWMQTGDPAYYQVSNGNDEPSGTKVGILYSASYNVPTGTTASVSGGECGLTFSNAALSDANGKLDFTLLQTGKIYVRNGTVGADGGIRVVISLGEEYYDQTKQAYCRKPLVAVSFNGVTKTFEGTPIEVRKPAKLVFTGLATKPSLTGTAFYSTTVTLSFDKNIIIKNASGTVLSGNGILNGAVYQVASGETDSPSKKIAASANGSQLSVTLTSMPYGSIVIDGIQICDKDTGTQALSGKLEISITKDTSTTGNLGSLGGVVKPKLEVKFNDKIVN